MPPYSRSVCKPSTFRRAVSATMRRRTPTSIIDPGGLRHHLPPRRPSWRRVGVARSLRRERTPSTPRASIRRSGFAARADWPARAASLRRDDHRDREAPPGSKRRGSASASSRDAPRSRGRARSRPIRIGARGGVPPGDSDGPPPSASTALGPAFAFASPLLQCGLRLETAMAPSTAAGRRRWTRPRRRREAPRSTQARASSSTPTSRSRRSRTGCRMRRAAAQQRRERQGDHLGGLRGGGTSTVKATRPPIAVSMGGSMARKSGSMRWKVEFCALSPASDTTTALSSRETSVR